jgi:hypothetical protein
MNHNKMDEGKGPKNNVKSGFVIGGLPKKVEWATIVFSEESQTVEEALKGKDAKKWEIVMHEKYDSLVANNTWSLVPLPKGRKPIFYNGCSKSNMGLMVKWTVIRLDLWQEVSFKHLESITMKLLHPLQSLCQFVVPLH